MHEQSTQIFISYANADQKRVIPFFNALEKDGFNVWLDCKKLKPGQNWDFEIKRALDKSNLVIAFLSETSINRRGYVQRELKVALDKLSEKLIDDIYIIPILLDEGLSIPEQFKEIQCISANNIDCVQKIQEALTYQLERLGLEVQKVQRQEEISWSYQNIKEMWDGLPGYEIELQFINFQSIKYKNVQEIGEYIKGDLLKNLFSARANKLDQFPDMFNYGQDSFRRTNTVDAHCTEVSIVGKILTVQYAIHWYGAGAAHGNMYFATYSFMLDPLFHISDISTIFKSPYEALTAIQACTRFTLLEKKIDGNDDIGLEPEWIDRGTKDWEDFSTFIPKEEGIEFLFSPYRVASFACGPQFAFVPYSNLVDQMRDEYICAFGVEHIAEKR
jgi:D-ribose pyranose/furanose isomerase RbsD